MIKVITQTTKERHEEIKEMFNKIRPFLDAGVSYSNAVKMGLGRQPIRSKNGWFRDLIEYGEKEGYSYQKLKYGKLKRPTRKYCKKILHEDNVEMPVLAFDNHEWSF